MLMKAPHEKLPKHVAGLSLLADISKNRFNLGTMLKPIFQNVPGLPDVRLTLEPTESVVALVLSGVLPSELSAYGVIVQLFSPAAYADKGSRVFGSTNTYIFRKAG